MTRAEFIAKSVRDAEKRIGVPPGWWGTYRDVYGPDGQRVKGDRRYITWTVSIGERMSKHDSREYAIKKARKP